MRDKIKELLRTDHWCIWQHPLASDLTDLEYEVGGEKHTLENVTPVGQRAEYMQLLKVQTFLEDGVESGGYPQWYAWSQQEVYTAFDESVKRAKLWMYKDKDLKLRHHK